MATAKSATQTALENDGAAPSDLAGSNARAWWAVTVLAAAYIFSYMDRQLMALLIQPIRAEFGISDTQVSLLTGLAFAACYSAAALPLGRLADLGRRRNIIAAGVTVWSVMTAACGLAGSFGQLFLARLGVGIGEAALPPAAYSMIADIFPRRRLALAMSVFVIGAPLGGAAALLVGGSLVGWLQDMPGLVIFGSSLKPWQSCFVVIGLAGLAVALLMFTIREPARRGKGGVADERPSIGSVVRFLIDNRAVFVPVLAACSLGNMFNYGMLTWMPTFLIRTYHWSLPQAGLAVGLLTLTFGVAGPLCGGWLVGWFTRRGSADACLRPMFLANMLLLPATLAFSLSPTPAMALPFMGLVIFGIFVNAGVFPTLLQVITPNRMRGQVSSVALLLVNLTGLGLGPSLYALTTDLVFGRDDALNLSLALTTTILLGASTWAIARGLRPYAAAASAAQAD